MIRGDGLGPSPEGLHIPLTLLAISVGPGTLPFAEKAILSAILWPCCHESPLMQIPCPEAGQNFHGCHPRTTGQRVLGETDCGLYRSRSSIFQMLPRSPKTMTRSFRVIALEFAEISMTDARLL